MNLMKLSNEEILEALKNQKIVVCVVGLGRIGLPTAAIFANSGFKVFGVDIDEKVVNEINSGSCRFYDEKGLKELVEKVTNSGKLIASCDVSSCVPNSDLIIMCVPTPVSETKVPNFSYIRQASSKVAKFLKKGTLIVIESTVSPGTVEDVIVPLIEKESGLKAGKDFCVASCPERANPGESLSNMHSVPRVIGGIDDRSTEIAAVIYKHALHVSIVSVSSPKTANAVKLTENIFRDVNIALMSEFAILYEKLGIDAIEVINACATKYNFIPHYPSAGVGGPCLPANAYYIIDEGLKVGYIPYLVRMAREINDRMPDHVVTLVTEALNKIGKVVSKSKIVILGVSYKPNVHDLQMTPFKNVFHGLELMGASVTIYDPMFKGETVFGVKVAQNMDDALKAADCIIIGVSHEEFKKIDLVHVAEVCNHPAALVDTQNIIAPARAKELGFSYAGVGRL
jgi:nucleotide sugar dehydrogenase